MGGTRKGKGRNLKPSVKDLLRNADPDKKKAFQAALKKRKGKKSTMKSPGVTVSQLLEKVEECLESFDYMNAQVYCQQALKKEPTNLTALEMLGNIFAETGNIEDAIECFGRSVELCPEIGYAKYMYLGQLNAGLEAINYFEKGIEIMLKDRDQAQDQENLAEGAAAQPSSPVSNQAISQAYSSIAEIYLTDACFEENAEARCKQCLDKALEEDPRNAEAHQLMASYWLSKEEKENAKHSIEQSLGIWRPQAEHSQNSEESSEEPIPLSYPLRIETAKILMELENLETAESILLTLLEEDDEVVQVWYMLGFIQVERKTEEFKPYGRYYLNKAKKLYRMTQCDDEPVLQHTKELLKELGPGEGDQEDWMEKMQEEQETGSDNGEPGDEEEDWSDDEDAMEQ